jgi:hypothetical protein
MVKRHIANALHIAKAMQRKGYGGGGVTPASLAQAWTPPEDAIQENEGPRYKNFMETYPEKLSQAIANAPNAIAEMPDKAYEFMKYPRQLLYGEKTFDRDEAANWSNTLGSSLLGMSAPSIVKMPAGGASTTRTFAGLAADTADVSAYRAAQAAREAGMAEDAIWKQHGWGWTKDNKPFFEISDQKATFTPHAKQYFEAGMPVEGHLKDILHHPEFFAAYPEAVGMRANVYPETPGLGKPSGKYWEDPKYGYMNKSELEVRQPTMEKALSTLMHEVNHGVQGYENFPRGASPSNLKQQFQSEVQKQMDEILAKRQQYERALTESKDIQEVKQLRSKINELTDLHKDMVLYKYAPDVDERAYLQYWKTHGEADSRNVQHRLDMPSGERRQVHPRHTLDVPREDLIVRYPRATGGSIVNRALVLMSSKAKRRRGRP